MNDQVALGSVIEVRVFVQEGSAVKIAWQTAVVVIAPDDTGHFFVERVDGSDFPGGFTRKVFKRSRFRETWR